MKPEPPPRTSTPCRPPEVRQIEPSHVWECLVPHLVHPVKLAIIEALLAVGEPLSPQEITAMLQDAGLYLSMIWYHLRRLEEAGIVEAVNDRGTGRSEQFFFFPLPDEGPKRRAEAPV